MQEGTFKKEGQRTQALMPKQEGYLYISMSVSIVFYLLNIAFLQFIDIAIIYIEKMIANLLANSNYLKFKRTKWKQRTVGRRLSYTFVAFSFRTLSHVLSFIKVDRSTPAAQTHFDQLIWQTNKVALCSDLTISYHNQKFLNTNNMTEIDIEYQKQKPDNGLLWARRFLNQKWKGVAGYLSDLSIPATGQVKQAWNGKACLLPNLLARRAFFILLELFFPGFFTRKGMKDKERDQVYEELLFGPFRLKKAH
ncbi:hypothetical protein ACJX0J_037131 [Zea mays]